MNPVGRSFRSGPSSAYSPPNSSSSPLPSNNYSYSQYRPHSSQHAYESKEETHPSTSFQPKYVQSFLSESLSSPPLHSSPQQRFPSPEYTSRRHSRSVSPHRPRSASRDETYNGYDHYSSPKMNAMTLPDEAPPTESLYHLASSPSHSRHGSSPVLGGMAGQEYSPMSVSSKGQLSGSTSPLQNDIIMSPMMIPSSHLPSTPTPVSFYPSSLNKTSALTAVNVFGFPPSVAQHVLQLFQDVGNLVQYQYVDGSNFMTLSYSSRIAAEKALKKNGRQVDVGGMAMMLGVVLVEPEIEQQPVMKQIKTPNQDYFSTPAKIPSAMTSPLARPTTLPGPSHSLKRESTAVYSPPSFHREPEPVQSSSLFNRISEFFFGW